MRIMKLLPGFAGKILSLLLTAALACAGMGLRAQTAGQGTVTVRGLIGSATYGTAGLPAAPLLLGTVVPIGSVIKTAPGAAVDLLFNCKAGVVRLLQNSTLSLDKFSASDSTPGGAVDIQLYLIEGSMVGFDKKLSNASKYQIKVAHGIADVGGSKYRIDAQGYLVILDGIALFAFVPPSGEAVPFELKASPPVYFSPVEGIRPAPEELVREVVLQTKGQLRGR